MKEILQNLNNKAFDNRTRLGIMSVLMVNESVDFVTFKDLLDVSDGNLSSHLSVLEKEAYLTVQKQFVGRKPQSLYSVSELGRKAFNDYLAALEQLLKNIP
jgi:DNA-binding transcriptional ArsR family regulator